MPTAQYKFAFHRLTASGDLLINLRGFEANAAIPALDDKRAVLQCKSLSTVKLEFRLSRIGVRRDLKVVLELPLISVENQIDSRINIFIAHASKLRHATPPLCGIVAHEVVALARKRIGSGDDRVGIRTDELHLQRVDLGCTLTLTGLFGVAVRQAQNGAFRAEKEIVARSPGHEFRARIGRIEIRLALIGLEHQRQSGKKRTRLRLRLPVRFNRRVSGGNQRGNQRRSRKGIRGRNNDRGGCMLVAGNRPEPPGSSRAQHQPGGQNTNSSHGPSPPTEIYVHAPSDAVQKLQVSSHSCFVTANISANASRGWNRPSASRRRTKSFRAARPGLIHSASSPAASLITENWRKN